MDEKPRKGGNEKPISFYPMTLEQVLKKAVNAKPPAAPKPLRKSRPKPK
ncbi:MAG: hypothetical protein SGJ19_20210 [Planctomycetia bacterium]|nr:hypothetical protein [Planctomycetia bacterium]